ncbi:MAG: polysaccharide [Geobacteraceae bacterium]|nr:MAG: polysaccharide [Geobacteraceae bacterium]
MDNAITIDVEEWFHVCKVDVEPVIPVSGRRVRQNIERILTLLAAFEVKATFFVLGSVAEEEPALVPMIAAAGHEIASHGYSHRLVGQLGPGRFRDEIRRTGSILERQAGYRPVGFRAPQWSLSRAMPWAFDILKEEGYLYDSSLNPLLFVGDPHGPRAPFKVETGGGSIFEIPPMVTSLPFINIPSGGGWGFRLFPPAVVSWTMRRLNKAGNPAVLYLHPREMDACGPRLKLSPLESFAVYGPRSDAAGRLNHLLQRFSFVTLRQLVESWESA